MRERPEILHVDLDAFFAAVEQRDKPSLRGRPVVVGGVGGRGVVATASYEARAFGVGSAMPMAEARRRCPNAAFLAGRFAAYRAASDVVMALLRELSPLVEPLSLDEAYVDLAATHPGLDVAGVREVAERLRAAIHEATGLTASVGAGTSKLVAKIASDLHKPDALTVVPPGQEAATLAALPARRLPGIGPASEERLRRRGLRTIGDLAAADVAELVEVLGSAHGAAVYAAARGVDDRPVVPEREAKSVSAEETYATDVTDPRLLADHVRRLTERVAVRLVKHGTSGRTVTLKVRRYDFTTLSRSVTLPQPTDSVREISAAATGLLTALDTSDGVRLLGVGVSGLTDFAQQALFTDPESAADAAGEEVSGVPEAAPAAPLWRPGQDVVHAEHGPGWVWGAGLGRVTVRFEGPGTPPGPVRTFAADDPDLAPAGPPAWPPTPP
ncbi:MAG: DNA polymerase IV [Actinomycetota bacterium]